MRITVTGATRVIGTKLVVALRERGDVVTALSRRPKDAQQMLGVQAVGSDRKIEPAPLGGLAGRDGVVHLAGEPIANARRGRARSAFARAASSEPQGSSKGSSSPILARASWSQHPPSATTARVAKSAWTKTLYPVRASSHGCARRGSARLPRRPASACAL